MNKKPILVTGSFRSGTTWVGKMIALSPQVNYIAEPFNTINGFLYGLDFKDHFYKIEEEETQEYYQKVKNGIGLSYNYGDLLRRLKSAPDPKHKFIAIARYFLYRRNILLKRRPLIKDPMALMSAEWLSKHFNTQNIVIIRHPAAFISSLERMGWGFTFEQFSEQPGVMKHLEEFRDKIEYFVKNKFNSDRIEAGILVWNAFHKIILDYKNQYPSWMFFTHEELSNDPHSHFKNIFKKLDLTFDESISKKIGLFTNSENPTEAEKMEAFSLKRNSRENVKIWKQRLKQEDIKRIFDGTEKISSNFYNQNDW